MTRYSKDDLLDFLRQLRNEMLTEMDRPTRNNWLDNRAYSITRILALDKEEAV